MCKASLLPYKCKHTHIHTQMQMHSLTHSLNYNIRKRNSIYIAYNEQHERVVGVRGKGKGKAYGF